MENKPLGRVIDNHEYQLLAEMSIDGFACITVESEENWKALPNPPPWNHLKWFPGKEEICIRGWVRETRGGHYFGQ